MGKAVEGTFVLKIFSIFMNFLYHNANVQSRQFWKSGHHSIIPVVSEANEDLINQS